jgi:hypothetical protein
MAVCQRETRSSFQVCTRPTPRRKAFNYSSITASASAFRLAAGEALGRITTRLRNVVEAGAPSYRGSCLSLVAGVQRPGVTRARSTDEGGTCVWMTGLTSSCRLSARDGTEFDGQFRLEKVADRGGTTSGSGRGPGVESVVPQVALAVALRSGTVPVRWHRGTAASNRAGSRVPQVTLQYARSGHRAGAIGELCPLRLWMVSK